MTVMSQERIPVMVNINNREELNTFLNKLTEDTEARWGLMKPQHMIEHLVKTLQHSNGKKEIAQKSTDEEAKQAKAGFIYTDVEMPMGLKSSLANETPDPLQYADLDAAKQQLNKELDDFDAYFNEHPTALFIQPRLGKLNHQEWMILHNKHFTHHFKQFGLV
jgi:oxepin-CoA hydrolase/3-oxo-5,6-dehydrosuberyl-CoA semialdehyde dehydrogenase